MNRITKGSRVMIPRSDGRTTPGVVTADWGSGPDSFVQVKLDERGSRGQELGKNIPRNELTLIEEA